MRSPRDERFTVSHGRAKFRGSFFRKQGNGLNRYLWPLNNEHGPDDPRFFLLPHRVSWKRAPGMVSRGDVVVRLRVLP